jgi:hypothetical protein
MIRGLCGENGEMKEEGEEAARRKSTRKSKRPTIHLEAAWCYAASLTLLLLCSSSTPKSINTE